MLHHNCTDCLFLAKFNINHNKQDTHTCKNLIPMVVTRAMANSSKNHALKNCQNGSFEPVHEIQKNFRPKAFF